MGFHSEHATWSSLDDQLSSDLVAVQGSPVRNASMSLVRSSAMLSYARGICLKGCPWNPDMGDMDGSRMKT